MRIPGTAPLTWIVPLLVLVVCVNDARAQLRQAEVLVAQGDMLAGLDSPVSNISDPRLNGLGQPGFSGWTDPFTQAFYWVDGEVVAVHDNPIWRGDHGGPGKVGFVDIPPPYTVFGQNGEVISMLDTAPLILPPGIVYWLESQRIDDSGSQLFAALVDDDTAVVYESPTATAGDFQLILRTGDVLPGSASASGGTLDNLKPRDAVGSYNGRHMILVEIDSFNNFTVPGVAVIVDGAIVAKAGEPTPDDDDWVAFGSGLNGRAASVAISNHGDYVVVGKTDAGVDSDEIIVVNHDYVLREGETVDGVQLGRPDMAHISPFGEVGHLWTDPGSSTSRRLFHSCTGDLRVDSSLILSNGDLLDTDGDGLADWALSDIIEFVIDDGFVFLTVELFFQDPVLALLKMETPACENRPLFSSDFNTGTTMGWSEE